MTTAKPNMKGFILAKDQPMKSHYILNFQFLLISAITAESQDIGKEIITNLSILVSFSLLRGSKEIQGLFPIFPLN